MSEKLYFFEDNNIIVVVIGVLKLRAKTNILRTGRGKVVLFCTKLQLPKRRGIWTS